MDRLRLVDRCIYRRWDQHRERHSGFSIAKWNLVEVQPRLLRRFPAKLIIINRDPTPLDDMADLVIHESIGETLRLATETATAE